MPFVVSSPGKVILFGEHSVVHGEPAIAASIALKTYIHVDQKDESQVTLYFPDTNLRVSWAIAELPFQSWKPYDPIPTDLDPKVVEALEPHLSKLTDSFQHAAGFAFLYLYVHICTPQTAGSVYTTRSRLPIGAGLGSSASLSVCIAGALLQRVAHFDLEPINSWSFIGEKCIQGNPSGIDNNVAARGGAVLFKKAIAAGDVAVLKPVKLKPMKLLLTNTRVPRRSKQLVANVGEILENRPAIVKPLLQAMGNLTTEAQVSLAEGDINSLQELVRLNHGLLVSLGVSHPSLERIRIASTEFGVGESKLTGAGGGGCAITVVPNSVNESSIKRFRDSLSGYEVFETILGGAGVGYADTSDSSEEFLANFVTESSLDSLSWLHPPALSN